MLRTVGLLYQRSCGLLIRPASATAIYPYPRPEERHPCVRNDRDRRLIRPRKLMRLEDRHAVLDTALVPQGVHAALETKRGVRPDIAVVDFGVVADALDDVV